MMLGSLPIGILLKNSKSIITLSHREQMEMIDSPLVLSLGSGPVDVLTGEDLFVGTLMAFALAFTISFLQSRRSQNDFVLWENISVGNSSDVNMTAIHVFDAEAWREISKPDNYIFYNRKVRATEKSKHKAEFSRTEKTWVFLALLTLFVPIFSVEFFFALSRQIICDGGNPMSQPDWADYLCSPADDIFIE